MRGMMGVAGEIPAAKLVQTGGAVNRSGKATFRPAVDSTALPGDILVVLCEVGLFPILGSGSTWQGDGLIRWQQLTAATMAVEFSRPDMTQPFRWAIIRNVRDIVRRINGTAYLSTAFSGFAKTENHVGLIMMTSIDPASGSTTPHVDVGAQRIPSIANYIRPAPDDDERINLHTFFYPPYSTYPNNLGFDAGDKASWPTDFRVYEMIGG